MAELNIGINLSTSGIPQAQSQLSRIFNEIERQGEVIRNANNRSLQTPPTAVRQARNPSSRLPVETDRELQSFINQQSRGLLGQFYKQFNGEELLRKLEAGASSVTAQGARPLTDLIRFYSKVKSTLDADDPANAPTLDSLTTQIKRAQELRDKVRASLVPESVLKENNAASKAQRQIEAFGAELRSRGFSPAGSYLETVTQFIRGVGQTNVSLRENLDLYEQSLLEERITPRGFQTGIAQLAGEATKIVNTAQKNAENLFKVAVKENAGDYAQAFEKVYSTLIPQGLSPTSGIVDQTVAGALRQQLLAGFEKDTGKSLKIRRGEFSDAKKMAAGAGGAGFSSTALITELDRVDQAVQDRISMVTLQLQQLRDFAIVSGDNDLSRSVQLLESAVNQSIADLNRQLQLERTQILDRAQKASAKATGGKSPQDLALAQFRSTVRSFESDLAREVDIQKGSPGGQSDTVDNFVRLSNATDRAIRNLVDVKFRDALATLNTATPTGLPNTLFRDLLDRTGFFNQGTTGGRIQALSTFTQDNLRAQVRAASPGISDEQLEAVTSQLFRQIQDLIQSYRVLDKAVEQLNVQRFAELRSAEELAISEGRLQDAMELRARQLFVAGVVPTNLQPTIGPNNVQMAMGNLTDAQLRAAGFATGDVSNNREDAARRDAKIRRARQAEEDARRTPFERISAFAGRTSAVFGFLQLTIGQVVVSLRQFIEQANELERTAATINAVAGGFDKFSQVVDVAVTQQQKFGGSLNEQLQGFTSLVQITRKYNVDLEQLDNVARRLAIIDPLQGFSGAAIALKEFFSGDITSLSRRFEIDRKTLNSVKDIADETERLQKLDEVLADLGISNAVLEARAQSTAAEYDRLTGNIQNATTLVGTGLQDAFLPTTRALNDWLSNYSDELADVQLRRESTNEALTQIASLSDAFRELSVQFERTEVSPNYFDAINMSITGSESALDSLIEKLNEYIAQINEARIASGELAIPTIRQDETDFATLLNQAGQFGVDTNRILENRVNPENLQGGIDDVLNTEEMMQIAELVNNVDGRFNRLFDMIEYAETGQSGLFGIEGPLARGNIQAQIMASRQQAPQDMVMLETELMPQIRDLLERPIQDLANMAPADRARAEMTYQLDFGNADAAIERYLTRSGARERLDSTGMLTGNATQDAQLMLQMQRADIVLADTAEKRRAEYADYIQTLIDLLGIQEEQPAVYTPPVNPYVQISEELSKIVKLTNDQSFGVDRVNKATEFLNELSRQQSDVVADAVIRQYERNKGLGDANMLMVKQNAELLNVVDTTDEAKAGTLAQLEALSQAQRLQAEYAFEADRSVSVLQVLNSEAGRFNLSMQQIVELALEFNKSMSNFNLGTILPLTSLQDQLSFRMEQLTQGTRANFSSGPRNQDEAFNIASQVIGLTKQMMDKEDKESDADKLAKLEKEYLEDRADAEKDYQKDMKELAEEYYEDMKRLLQESEISKRGNKADFYESLFGMDLTNEQRATYIDQFKGYEAEATKLRGEGNFTAAEAVLETGSQQILNQAKYDAEVIDNKEKIKDADKEIIDLQKDLKDAKEKDDREEIQRKIDKANQDKLDAENRIKQIEGLRQLRADADREEVEQARLKEEQITTDYKKEVEKREQDFKDKLADMEKAYNKSVEERSKTDDAATKQELANRNLVISLEMYRVKVNQLAKLYTMGASDQAIANQKKLIETSESAIMNQAGPELKPIFKGLFDSLDSLDASPAQDLDPAVVQQLRSLSDNTDALSDNTTALTGLVNTLGRVVIGNRLRVTLTP
jgi:hypothetical protein